MRQNDRMKKTLFIAGLGAAVGYLIGSEAGRAKLAQPCGKIMASGP